MKVLSYAMERASYLSKVEKFKQDGKSSEEIVEMRIVRNLVIFYNEIGRK